MNVSNLIFRQNLLSSLGDQSYIRLKKTTTWNSQFRNGFSVVLKWALVLSTTLQVLAVAINLSQKQPLKNVLQNTYVWHLSKPDVRSKFSWWQVDILYWTVEVFMITTRDFSFHFSCYPRKGGRGVSSRFILMLIKRIRSTLYENILSCLI